MTIVQRWTGHEAAALRQALRMSVRGFAAYLGAGVRTVASWEADGAKVSPRPEMQEALDTALARATDDAKARFEALLKPDDVHAPTKALSVGDYDEEAEHNFAPSDELRQLLHGFLVQPRQRPSGNLMAGIDEMRRSIDRTLMATCSITLSQVDHIEARVQSNARLCLSVPPLEMLCRLTLDLAEVQDCIVRRQLPPVQQGLYRTAALLSALLADELMVVGDVRQSQAWYATARFAADQTNDVALQADVRTFAALLPLYYGDANEAVNLAREAQQIAAKRNCLARAVAPTYEAVGLAQLGATEASKTALSTARQQMASLDPVYQAESIFGFPQRRWRFYEGKVLSYLGRSDEAWAIHDEALALYPEDVPGDPALIRFDRAISLIRSKQVAGGCQVAEQSLLELPEEHRTDIFIRAARRVLAAVPSKQRTQQAVQQYRHTLRTCAIVLRAEGQDSAR